MTERPFISEADEEAPQQTLALQKAPTFDLDIPNDLQPPQDIQSPMKLNLSINLQQEEP
jgi:hypothetical protein